MNKKMSWSTNWVMCDERNSVFDIRNSSVDCEDHDRFKNTLHLDCISHEMKGKKFTAKV